MSRLFEGRIDFNDTGISKWNTAKVTSFAYMFDGCQAFDQVLEWDFSSAETLEGMFNGATSYNQDFVGWLSTTTTARVTNMAFMFNGATKFDANVMRLDTANVVNMTAMFRDAQSFRGIGIESWNVEKVQRFDRTFMGASSFNGDVTQWKPKSVTTMHSMFEGCTVFDQDIASTWRGQLSADLQNLSRMFYDAIAFDYSVCWPGLSSRIMTSNMFCRSPGSLDTSCFSNPSTFLYSNDCAVPTNNGGPGFNEDNFVPIILPENETNLVLVPGDGSGGSGGDDEPGVVIVGVTSETASSASASVSSVVAAVWWTGTIVTVTVFLPVVVY